jgi:hypothetical protein
MIGIGLGVSRLPILSRGVGDLDLGDTPTILEQASDATIDEGETYLIGVTASGTEPLSYQWYQGASGDTSSPISGANINTYNTPALTETTQYWVRVINAAGFVNGNTVTITVTPADAGFDPADYGTVKLYLDSDTLATAGFVDEDVVDLWADQSGNALDATQPTFGSRPTFYESVDAKPVLYFDGSGNILNGESLGLGTADQTIVTVAKTITGGRVHFSTENNHGIGHTHDGDGGNGFGLLFGSSAWASMAAAKLDEWIIQVSVTVSGVTTVWANGVEIGSAGATINSDNSGYVVGGDSFARSECYITDVVIYASALSTANREALETALGVKRAIPIT